MVPSSAWRWLDWLSETASYGLVESYVIENSFDNSLRPPLKLFPTHQTTSPLPQFTYYVELNCSSFDWPWDEMVMFRHQVEEKPHFFFFKQQKISLPSGRRYLHYAKWDNRRIHKPMFTNGCHSHSHWVQWRKGYKPVFVDLNRTFERPEASAQRETTYHMSKYLAFINQVNKH